MQKGIQDSEVKSLELDARSVEHNLHEARNMELEEERCKTGEEHKRALELTADLLIPQDRRINELENKNQELVATTKPPSPDLLYSPSTGKRQRFSEPENEMGPLEHNESVKKSRKRRQAKPKDETR